MGFVKTLKGIHLESRRKNGKRKSFLICGSETKKQKGFRFGNERRKLHALGRDGGGNFSLKGRGRKKSSISGRGSRKWDLNFMGTADEIRNSVMA